MTSEPLTDVLGGVTRDLAAVLRVGPERIEPHQQFRALGLDSIRTAELMAAVNARFGTAVAADALYDHPTPAALARHIEAETAAAPGPAPAARAATAEADVREALRGQLADILGCDPARIDPGAPFRLLGVDSILAAEFVAAINDTYRLAERPVTLYDHPDLAAMAAHIASAAGTESAGPAPAPAPPAPARPALTSGEVNALLDAVRADMLTVDEAAALLASRPA